MTQFRQPTVMKHDFSRVPKADIPRSQFDRSHGFKTTFNSGYLVPFFVDEALPGDTFNLNATLLARLATPIVPIMDNLFLETFYFAVPYRLLWSNWERFNGSQDNPTDSTDFLVPQIDLGTDQITVGDLADYFGLPTQVNGIKFNSLHFRAYNLIYNEWFRDQNLQDSVPIDLGDGPDSYADFTLLRRGKRHDYFTSCLPWPQKGIASTIAIGGTASLVYNSTAPLPLDSTGSGIEYTDTAGAFTTNRQAGTGVMYGSSAGATTTTKFDASTGHFLALQADATDVATMFGNSYADLSTATGTTINSLRQSFQIQKLLERDARGGTRYTEILRAHFGVFSPDARLQRPEYLGGGSQQIGMTPVAQTSESGGTPQGNLAGFSSTISRQNGFVKSFTEHCALIGLMSVRADLNYQQGMNRMWSRQTRYDYYWPALSHLGEQAVLNQEIYAQGNPHDLDVFGYQERYAEYRYKPSLITGQFRSTYSTPLDFWHLAINFGSLPALNASFIQDNPPVSRVIAVPSEPQFLLDCHISLKCARPMPTYSVPGLIDHF